MNGEPARAVDEARRLRPVRRRHVWSGRKLQSLSQLVSRLEKSGHLMPSIAEIVFLGFGGQNSLWCVSAPGFSPRPSPFSLSNAGRNLIEWPFSRPTDGSDSQEL